MTGDGLFDDLPESAKPSAGGAGQPRLREPVRDQIELRVMDVDGLIGAAHPARVIWAYVEKLDLGSLEDAVRARAHTPGQAPARDRKSGGSGTSVSGRVDLGGGRNLQKKKQKQTKT